MKIKLKLTLGVGLLFLFIIGLAALGMIYINALNKDTQNILVANYNTLDYSREMMLALDEDFRTKTSTEKFSENLLKQRNNITEPGEKELTEKLVFDFQNLKANPENANLCVIVRKDLAEIMLLNMQAIQRKSNIAKLTASNATLWISIAGTLCFLIAFILLVNLPGNIANPIKELTLSIKQIAEKKYEQRVHFESHNEFGELAKSFNTMAEKLQEYNNSNLSKIMIEKKRIETLINNMNDPVMGLDEKHKIIFANEEILKIIGLGLEELIGQKATDIAVNNDLMRILIKDLFSQKPAIGKSKVEPLKIYANGKESYFEKNTLDISIKPTGENVTTLIGHVIVLRNVTEYKELDAAKTNFIATVSHEFKTPISSIKLSLQLMENEKMGKLNDNQKHLLESIHDDADRLLNITGELLKLTQVESGNIQLSIVQVDPLEIVDYAINANKIQAEQKHIKLLTNFEKELPKIQADREKTTWVITNLISNAIRYSYENSDITISVVTAGRQVEITVKDTGQGIAPHYQNKIFERYFRVPGANVEGTGLGLAISKEFIEAQGGSISVKSELGVGSIFRILVSVV